MWQSVEVLNVFITLTLKQMFWKGRIFLKKLEYRFLVESTKLENASFLYKTAIPEANGKTNWMVSTFHKECSFASNYFFFFFFLIFENFASVWEPFKTFYNLLEAFSAGVLFEGAFSL